METTFTKVAVATVIAGTTLFGGAASAATKEEVKATDRYSALKNGMTIEQAAKVIYGKDYKKQVTTKNGSKVLKLKEEMKYTEDGQKTIVYGLYNRQSYVPADVTALMFTTKKKDSVYRLTLKQIDLFRDTKSGYRESTRQLVKGKKFSKGMNEKQVDAILTGSGLGEWSSLNAVDMTFVQPKKEVDAGFGIKVTQKTYVFKTSTSQRKLVSFVYDTKKKMYVIESTKTL